MEMKLRYTPLFEKEITSALSYLIHQLHDSKAAQDLKQELDRAAELVQRYPYSMSSYPTRAGRRETYRAVDVKNYLAFYVILDDTVEFRRFLPSRSDFAKKL